MLKRRHAAREAVFLMLASSRDAAFEGDARHITPLSAPNAHERASAWGAERASGHTTQATQATHTLVVAQPVSAPAALYRVTAGALDGSAPHASATLDDAYAYCQRVTREIARTFYYGSVFLPAEKRRAAWALYAFCRIADDIADEPGLYPKPDADLARWRQALLDTYAGRPRGPVMRAWADTLTRYAVPLQPALDLLDGVEMDIRGDTYETFDQLRLYCYRVAGAAGLLMAPILGYTGPEALDAAVDLGIAMQLTNILRDLGEDARRGRVYLPADELAAFGYPRAALERGERTPAFYELMRFQIARAETYYQRGLRGVALLDADARLAIALSGVLYRAILQRIRRNGYDVFTRRAHISTAGKLAMLPNAWLRVRLGLPQA